MSVAASHLRHAIASGFDALASLVACIGFWSSIVLPFLHVPLFVAAGLTETTVPVLATLWTVNAFGLLVGARHTPSASIGPLEGRNRRAC